MISLTIQWLRGLLPRQRAVFAFFLLIFLGNIFLNAQAFFTTGTIGQRVWLMGVGADYPFTSLLLTVLVVWFMTQFVDRRPFASLGLTLRPAAVIFLLDGIFIGGITIIGATYAIVRFEMGLDLEWPFLAPFSQWGTLIVLAFQTAIVPLYEELIFRGYLLQTLIRAIGASRALLATSALFGFWHTHYGWIGGLEYGIFGLAMGAAYLRTRSLWWPIGLHFGWNLVGAYAREWGWNASPTAANPWQVELLNDGNLTYTLATIVMLIAVAGLPIRPHPRDKALADKYVHRALWPPWQTHSAGSGEEERTRKLEF